MKLNHGSAEHVTGTWTGAVMEQAAWARHLKPDKEEATPALAQFPFLNVAVTTVDVEISPQQQVTGSL